MVHTRKGKFSEEQISTALRQVDNGAPILEVIRTLGSARRHTVSGANAICRWLPPRFSACGNWRMRIGNSSSHSHADAGDGSGVPKIDMVICVRTSCFDAMSGRFTKKRVHRIYCEGELTVLLR